MTQKHAANMAGTPTRLNQVVDLIGGLTGTELHELRDHFATDRASHGKIFEQDLETRFQEAKTLWATLTMTGDRRAFKEGLQDACTHAKSVWAAIDTLEQFEAWRARTETRAKLQAAFDAGLAFQKATIDGEAFHVDGGLVVEGQAVVSDADMPF